MSTKLTLTIDKSVIDKAKKFAKASGRSLSDIVESYLEKLVAPVEESEEEIPEEFRGVFAVADLNHIQDDQATLIEILEEKYKS